MLTFILENNQLFWLIAMVLFLVVEMATAISLTSIWFCIGALAGILAAAAGLGFSGQCMVFLGVSLLMLFFTRPFLKKIIRPQYQATNADKILGASCMVVETIDNAAATGAVKFDGKLWTARSLDPSDIFPSGEQVIAETLQGVTVYVKSQKKE